VTSVILYQGLKASATTIITVVLAFLVICTGITILQMSKVDPRKLSNVRGSGRCPHRNLADHFCDKVDEHTTLLLEVAKQEPAPKASRDLDAKIPLLRHVVTPPPPPNDEFAKSSTINHATWRFPFSDGRRIGCKPGVGRHTGRKRLQRSQKTKK
jgi:hypothetical protein